MGVFLKESVTKRKQPHPFWTSSVQLLMGETPAFQYEHSDPVSLLLGSESVTAVRNTAIFYMCSVQQVARIWIKDI